MKRYLVKVALEHFAFGLTLSVSVIWMLAQGLMLTDIALITSLALALGLVVDIPTGAISDKFGRKPILISASLFIASAFLLFAFSHDFWQFLFAASLQAIGFALASGSEEAFIYEMIPRNYRKTLSNVNVVDETATIAGLLVAPLLITQFSLRTVFVAATSIVFMAAVAGWIIIKD
jgi:MFS family permease